MAITKAVPTIWAARIKANLLTGHVFGSAGIVNRDYEGDISDFGVTVKIIGVQKVAIKTYTKNAAIAAPDVLTDDELLLTIDQAFYFNFAVDDIDAAQTKPKLVNEASRTAAWGLMDKSDLFISNAMLAASLAGSTQLHLVGAPVSLTPADAYELLVDMGVSLTTRDIPQEGRWAVCPPNFYGLIQKDDRFVHATAQGDAMLANGLVGRVAGFTLYQSNNITEGAAAGAVIAGQGMAFSFAEQLLRVEAFRPDTMFADALKGLYVFGGKAIWPEALSTAYYNLAP